MNKHSINICFSTTDDVISKVIRRITKSKISHCYISFREQTFGRVMIMEADWQGFRLVPWDEELLKGRRLIGRYSVNVEEEKQLTALHELTFYLGHGYNYRRLFYLLVSSIDKRIQRPLNSTNKMICSEAVIRFLNGCGAANIANPELCTPADVYKYILDHPGMFVREE